MERRIESRQDQGAVQLLITAGLVLLLMALLFWGLQAASPAHADPGNLYVDGAGGSDDSDCSSPADPCATIGYALAQAASGDEILVAEGTYPETLQVQLSVTLKGGYEAAGWTRDIGAQPTIVDANGADSSAISIQPGLNVTVEGFVVQGADHQTGRGGGFFIENATAVISATIIRHNSGTFGGGIEMGQGDELPASLTLINSALLTNTASVGGGGGLDVGGWPSVTLDNVEIRDNTAAGSGGGIGGSWATLTNCRVVNNTAGAEGGGIGLFHVRIHSSTISHNQAASAGGSGILVRFGRLHLQDSIVSHNHGSGHGIEAANASSVTVLDTSVLHNDNDGLACWSSPFTLTNVLIADNGGSGIVGDSNPLRGTMMNVTIANNGNNGLQMTGDDVRVTNSILWGSGGQDNNCGGTCTLAYSDIGSGDTTGTGNLSYDPGFADPANGDYRLQAWSPCIDAGTATGAPNYDLDGTPRPQNTGYDLGTYEFAGTPQTTSFDEVAAELGLDVSSGEFGAAWGDLNGDDWLDLAIGDGSLFTNNAGTGFSDATGTAGLDSIPQYGGVAWGDYDNDGDLDLLSSWGKIYRHDGPSFVKVLDAGGAHQPLAWVDYDVDGDLDAYASDALYRNNGGDTFTDVTAEAGLEGSSIAAVWADYDWDWFPDLYKVCNSCANSLYFNRHNDTFVDVTAATGVGDAGAGHAATWGDYDNDGDLDLFLANNDDQYSVLYRNQGDGTFQNATAAAGLYDQPGNATSANWLDYDLDGWLDLFVVQRSQPNRLYHNLGDGTFGELGAMAGVADGGESDGSAVGDYDNDGDPDLYVISGFIGTGEQNLLYRNNTDPGAGGPHWLKVRLRGSTSNRSAIGARVRVYAGGQMLTRTVAGSTGYMSQDAPEALFGLGAHDGSVRVEILWPSWVLSTWAVDVDQAVTLVEPPRTYDIAVFDARPAGEVVQGTTVDVRANLYNAGNQTVTPMVQCAIKDSGGLTAYSYSNYSPPIEPGKSAWVAMAPWTVPKVGAFTLTCHSELIFDQTPSNDVYESQLLASAGAPDVWAKDHPGDTGSVPSYPFWESPDIWVRNDNDCRKTVHQNPIAGQTNRVCIRVRNRGTRDASGQVLLAYSLARPSMPCQAGYYYIGSPLAYNYLRPGEERILSASWTPTRADVFALFSVLEAIGDPVSRELWCSADWPRYDNNVSWRNVQVYLNPGGQRSLLAVQQAEVPVANLYDLPQEVDLVVERLTFPLAGGITLRLPADLFDRWLAYGASWGEGIDILAATKEIRVTGAVSATIGAIPMSAGEVATATLLLDGPAGLQFELGLRQRIQGEDTGGITYQWLVPDATPPAVLGTTPAGGASNVAPSAPLIITFDEPIGPLGLDLALAPDPGGWFFFWNDDYTVVTATHSLFAARTSHTATVTANDAWGNLMTTPFIWTFATGSFQVHLPLVMHRGP